MTKELLEQYPHICAEIRDLRRVERDVVSMSSYDPPYTQHAQSVQGVVVSDMDLLLHLKAQKAQIEEFVRKLPRSEWRRVVKMRAFEGLCWNDIAGRMSKLMGRVYSYDKVRNIYRKVLSYCK